MKARLNPFTVRRIAEIRYEPQDATWEHLLERLERLQFRAAIVGAHGSGKTTMLETLQPQLEERGFGVRLVRLNEGKRTFSQVEWDQFRAADYRTVALLDGAEQLSWRIWRRLLKQTDRAAGLVITVHQPSRLPTWYRCCTDPELLAELIAKLSGTKAPGVLPLARELYHRHQGNLRDALREMYDRYAEQ